MLGWEIHNCYAIAMHIYVFVWHSRNKLLHKQIIEQIIEQAQTALSSNRKDDNVYLSEVETKYGQNWWPLVINCETLKVVNPECHSLISHFISSDRSSYSDSEILSISANIHSSMMFYDDLWWSMMFYDILWFYMMLYDVL